MEVKEQVTPTNQLLKPPLQKQIRIKTWTKSTVVIRSTLVILAVLTVYAFFSFDYKDIDFGEAVIATVSNLKAMFVRPHLEHFTFSHALYQVFITLGLAFLTTLFGAIIAVFLGLLAAENLTNKRVSTVIKGVVAFIRAVPTVLWVLIFAVAAGLGSVAAVIGMTFHSVSYLVKAYSESFEELDNGVIEALQASGASWWQIIFQAVIPSSLTYMISWTFLRFEINFAVAIAMGAAAGAGGIGFDMFMASSFYLDIREIGAITYFILAIAILLEVVAIQFKKKLKVNE
ncbi:ABC transporter permease subunit [Radiobacillus kanasensis]|uniref:PhnE/PtxC family ABC transporter permease n=1 Tax=Radiobacillus kanasensis TaxID=2844358 RepID=UPI001E5068EB|nr:ABC transporter permease subunit [Radiobacillus kanasensis]UFT99306.1 ABC transporter permease subunit [Radiobacillus kanasensis]